MTDTDAAEKIKKHILIHHLNEDSGVVQALRQAIAKLEDQPATWIINSDRKTWWYECSNCHSKPLKSEWGNDSLSLYCPNCGKRMNALTITDEQMEMLGWI